MPFAAKEAIRSASFTDSDSTLSSPALPDDGTIPQARTPPFSRNPFI